MELVEAAEFRQSIRNYKEGVEIPKEQLEELVRFAQKAPSWKNFQTGRYYVVTSDEKIAELRDALPSFNQKSTVNASAYIVTTFEKSFAGFGKDKTPDNELGDEWGAYDLGLQNAYLILKAAELGIDSLIMGIRDGEKLRKVLDIPESQEVGAVISLGYRIETPEKRPRKEMKEIAVFC